MHKVQETQKNDGRWHVIINGKSFPQMFTDLDKAMGFVFRYHGDNNTGLGNVQVYKIKGEEISLKKLTYVSGAPGNYVWGDVTEK